MNTLADAWTWYISTQKNLERMQRLGRKHWQGLPWVTGSIGKDNEFRTLESSDIISETTAGLAPIDDLAIVVLFSVFEAVVRSHVVNRIQPEAEALTDSILKHACDDAIRGVEEGSFFRRVLEPLKQQGQVSADLVTQVDQVRNYRNWVAHGRRGTPANSVTPRAAFERLSEFLDALGIIVESERIEAEN